MIERTKRPRDRRRRIQDAAADLFADGGFAGTSVGDIADAVGITGGAIYRHFKGKDELLETLVLETVQQLSSVSRVDAATPDERLRRLVSRSVDLALTRPSRVATYLRERGGLPRALKSKVRRHERQIYESWRAIMVEANPVLTEADVVARQAAINGVFTSLARRRQTVKRPRLDTLAAGGIIAVMTAPGARSAPPDEVSASAWTPPRSRRAEILAVAATLFRRQGYHGVGIDQIGEAAGIAGPTIYGTFDSKAEILVDIYEHVMARLESVTETALATAASAETALHEIVRAHVEVAFTMTDLIVVASREERELAEPDRRRIDRRIAEHRLLWAGILGQVRPDLTEAEASTLAAAALMLMQRIALAQRTANQTVDAAADLALAFLLAPPAGTITVKSPS